MPSYTGNASARWGLPTRREEIEDEGFICGCGLEFPENADECPECGEPFPTCHGCGDRLDYGNHRRCGEIP
jgi:hypothetical protein